MQPGGEGGISASGAATRVPPSLALQPAELEAAEVYFSARALNSNPRDTLPTDDQSSRSSSMSIGLSSAAIASAASRAAIRKLSFSAFCIAISSSDTFS